MLLNHGHSLMQNTFDSYDFCLAFWRKTYKYKLSTFSRAHGVVRKNRNDDLTLGSMQKHLISILRLKPSKPS